jgi:ubiquitin carboxyl-terminal hydrolase 5/13
LTSGFYEFFSFLFSTGYRLTGIVSHIGTSTHCGHYVAHILKDGRWVIFNDNKVGASINPPKDMGYLYFFERLDS